MPTNHDVAEQLERICRSETFVTARKRSMPLLRYIIQSGMAGKPLKELIIAVDYFKRDSQTFNGDTDPIVRVSVSGIRTRLADYYSGEGQLDAVIISIPPGAYNAKATDNPPSGDEWPGLRKDEETVRRENAASGLALAEGASKWGLLDGSAHLSSIHDLARRGQDLDGQNAQILLVTGEDREGNAMFAYVLVPADKVQAFLNAQELGHFDPADFGVILASGSGNPSQELQKALAQQYGLGSMETLPNDVSAWIVTPPPPKTKM